MGSEPVRTTSARAGALFSVCGTYASAVVRFQAVRADAEGQRRYGSERECTVPGERSEGEAEIVK